MSAITKVTVKYGQFAAARCKQFFGRDFMEGFDELDDEEFLLKVIGLIEGPDRSYGQQVVSIEEGDEVGEVVAVVQIR